MFLILYLVSLNTFNSKSGKGERLIVLHAGGKDGWISGKQIVLSM